MGACVGKSHSPPTEDPIQIQKDPNSACEPKPNSQNLKSQKRNSSRSAKSERLPARRQDSSLDPLSSSPVNKGVPGDLGGAFESSQIKRGSMRCETPNKLRPAELDTPKLSRQGSEKSLRSAQGAAPKKGLGMKSQFFKASNFAPLKFELQTISITKVYTVLSQQVKKEYLTTFVVQNNFSGEKKTVRVYEKEGENHTQVQIQALFSKLADLKIEHENFLVCHELYEDKQLYYLIHEHITGEKLQDFLTLGQMPQSDIPCLIVQMVDLVKRLHENDYVHGKLSFTSFQYSDTSPSRRIVLIDFEALVDRQFCCEDKTQYMPPEYKKTLAYSKAGDIWALGVMIYHLLSRKTVQEIHQSSLGSKPVVGDNCGIACPQAKALLQAMLMKEPEKRCQIEDVASSVFYHNMKETLEINSEQIVDTVEKFRSANLLQRFFLAYLVISNKQDFEKNLESAIQKLLDRHQMELTREEIVAHLEMVMGQNKVEQILSELQKFQPVQAEELMVSLVSKRILLNSARVSRTFRSLDEENCGYLSIKLLQALVQQPQLEVQKWVAEFSLNDRAKGVTLKTFELMVNKIL